MTLLCISENQIFVQQIKRSAEAFGWMLAAANRETLEATVSQIRPDMIVIDIANGGDVEALRLSEVFGFRNVIGLHGQIDSKIMAELFDAGVDVMLPYDHFSNNLFESCVRSLLRRSPVKTGKFFVSRLEMTVDQEDRSVEVGGETVKFTSTEFNILRALVIEEAGVVNRSEILTKVFNNSSLASRSLDVHVCTLRKKIRHLGLDVISVRGVGYKMRAISVQFAEA